MSVPSITHKIQSCRQALLLSSSNCHGYSILEFAKQEITSFLNRNNVKELVFVPYAQTDYKDYTRKMKDAIEPWGFTVTGLHTYMDPAVAINSTQAIFIGGGNTFLLLKTLYEYNLIDIIKKRVLQDGMLYIGSSAGTNVATKSIHTTNDMPITHPPSFSAIGIVPFNINPHYIDHTESETHKGETRDQRITEYLGMPHSSIVLGLREGAILSVEGNSIQIRGVAGAVVFEKNKSKVEYPVGADLSFLL